MRTPLWSRVWRQASHINLELWQLTVRQFLAKIFDHNKNISTTRHVRDAEQVPGRSHIRQLPADGPDEPEHGGELRLVHRDGARPHLPSLRLRRGLPDQAEQGRQVRRTGAGGRSRSGRGLR